jgi:hypothetical protein
VPTVRPNNFENISSVSFIQKSLQRIIIILSLADPRQEATTVVGATIILFPLSTPQTMDAWESGFAVALFVGTALLSLISRKNETEDKIDHHSKEEVLRLRQQLFSKSLSVSYENSNPLMFMKVRFG